MFERHIVSLVLKHAPNFRSHGWSIIACRWQLFCYLYKTHRHNQIHPQFPSISRERRGVLWCSCPAYHLHVSGGASGSGRLGHSVIFGFCFWYSWIVLARRKDYLNLASKYPTRIKQWFKQLTSTRRYFLNFHNYFAMHGRFWNCDSNYGHIETDKTWKWKWTNCS